MFIDPTFFGIFVCGPVQFLVVNVCAKSIPVFRPKRRMKTLLVGAADTYMAYIRATPRDTKFARKKTTLWPAAYRLINFELFSVPKW